MAGRSQRDSNHKALPINPPDNIRIVGPDPVPVPNFGIERTGANVKLTFDGWLEAADAPQGPFTVVAVHSPVTIPATGAAKFYRARN